MEHVKFKPGIQTEVFEYLKLKFSRINHAHEREAVLVFDGMKTTPGIMYDKSTKSYIGQVNLPGHEGIGSHGLTFTLAGITTRWKQIVAYYYTGDSVDGKVFKPIVEDIIDKSSEIGLNIKVVTSDMDGSNQAFWSALGVRVSRNQRKNYFLYEGKKIYVMPDPPHAFKNLRTSLINNKVMRISQEIQKKYNLKSNEIKLQHFETLIQKQKGLTFPLAHKLNEDHISNKNKFAKMRVNRATNFFSSSVSAGMKLLGEESELADMKTTAWFVQKISRWFTLMTSRSRFVALSKTRQDKFEEAKKELNEVMEIFQTIEIGDKWKPVQTAIIMSTMTILDLATYYLDDLKIPYLLTSRFTQDCQENIFSLVRKKHPTPNSLQFKQDIKLISISQFLKRVLNGNYDFDDRPFLGEFLSTNNKKKNNLDQELLAGIVFEDISHLEKDLVFEKLDLNTSYYTFGYLISSLIKSRQNICEECVVSVSAEEGFEAVYTKYTTDKKYTSESQLFFMNELTFFYFLKMERVFQSYIEYVKLNNINANEFFYNELFKITADHIKTCHNFKEKIMKKFISFRLNMSSGKNLKLDKNEEFSSKTMAMHARTNLN